ncbi:MAG: hypothetical protein FJY65_04300 [Calditrichaeota bacterium]|nr:hypothetical protein [Calditrichota bacterium]
MVSTAENKNRFVKNLACRIALVLSICLLQIPLDAAYAEKYEDSTGAPVIWAIKVVGNRVTSAELIRREMTLKPGMAADRETIDDNRLHLMSLGLFNYVAISLASDQGRAVAIVKVTEKLYVYPFPIFDYDPLEPKRRIFGVRFIHDNFRGAGERLNLAWWDGYQRGMSFLHRDPWFSIRGLYGVRLMGLVNEREIKDPNSGEYVKTKTELLLTRIKRRISRRAWLGLEFQWEERSSKAQFYTLAGKGRDKLTVGRIIFEDNIRDYIYYPTEGYYIAVAVEGNRMVDTTYSFFRQQVDIRAYRPLSGVILAGRLWLENSRGALPYYRRLELTTNEVRSDEAAGLLGTTTAALNIELRFNILPLTYISLPDWYLIGPYVKNLKFSLEGLLFVDRGWVRRSPPLPAKHLTAGGAGVQFQLPYVETARILAGWGGNDKLLTPLLILGVNVTF